MKVPEVGVDNNCLISKVVHWEAKMTKPRVPYFGHIMGRQDSLEKTLTLGKFENKKKKTIYEMD